MRGTWHACTPPVLLLTLLVPAATVGGQWKRIEAGWFSISFPSEPKREERSEDTKLGRAETTNWTLDLEGRSFLLSVSEYPPGSLDNSIPGTVIEAARDGMAANIGASIDTDYPILLNSGIAKKKWPGREVTMHTRSGMRLEGRLFLVGDRLVVLIVTHESTQRGREESKAFFESFRLHGPRNQRPE